MKKKVYYAHSVALYNTPQEERDIATLEKLNLEVFNPNQQKLQDEFNEQKQHDYVLAFEQVFLHSIQECDVFAFRALPDGRIPGGVAKELVYAQEQGKTIIELPVNIIRRSMEVDETREFLEEIGQR